MKTIHHHKFHTHLFVVATSSEERRKLRSRGFFQLRDMGALRNNWLDIALSHEPGTYTVKNIEDEMGHTIDFEIKKMSWSPLDWHARSWNANT
jgi:hypothetical protein